MQERPCILYAPAAPGDAIVEAEVAGVRRFAAARGWTVRPVAADTPETVRDAIRRMRPLGCIVNLANDRRALPPSLFRGIPLVYVHPPHAMRRRGVPFVARDNEAIARFAFRELAAGRPDSFAFVGSRFNRAWSRERERAFRALAAEAGKPCAVFPPRPAESDAARAAAAGLASPDCDSVFIGPLLVVRRESTRGRGRRKPHIAEAVATIRAEACDGLDAATLAARFPGSRRLFEMRFREAMGHSVLDEILDVRLETAKSLLAHGRVALSALASFCGFSGYPALQKAFRSRTGMTMSAWRKLHFK